MPKLARTLDIISEKNVSAYYHDGELTKFIIEEINENGKPLEISI
jgi:gamma-glutamyltranspeptidase